MPRFAVIGLGRFGEKLAQLLAQRGVEVIGIDSDEAIVQRIRDDVTLAITLDSTDEQALLAQGIDKVDCAVVGIGTDFEANMLTVTILKKIGVPRVISRAGSGMRGRILERIGCDEIAWPEDESARRWANRLTMPQFESLVELDDETSLVQVPVPKSFVHRTLRELDIRRKYRLNVVGIRRQEPSKDESARDGRRFIGVADPDEPLQPGDMLVLIGGNENLSELPTE